jgi:peptidylprolyl isomerase domain and WD repeat-containing protein 1
MRKYDESLEAIQEMQQAGTAISRVDDMEFGRRLALEKELELPGPDGHIPARWANVIWDESGAFIIYPTLLGIKGTIPVAEEVHNLNQYSISREHRDKSRRPVTWKG